MKQRRALALTAWREREHAVLSEAEKQNVSTQTKTAEALQAIAAASQGNTEAMMSMMQAFIEKMSGIAAAAPAPAKPPEKKPG
jgi:flagellum-specific peptidoglycan hydrolase FlgJ